jgi:hypothetical protein
MLRAMRSVGQLERNAGRAPMIAGGASSSRRRRRRRCAAASCRIALVALVALTALSCSGSRRPPAPNPGDAAPAPGDAASSLDAAAVPAAALDAAADSSTIDPQAPARLQVRVFDPDSGAPIACKLLLTAADPALGLNFGGGTMIGEWISPRALGNGNAVYADPCDFELSLAPGDWHLQASQGFERELAMADVHLAQGSSEPVALPLARALDTRGYACADFHVHSAPSFDSDVPLDQRLISALAEGLDAIAPTDHDAVGDWEADMARLELADELTLVLGDEVTPDSWSTPQPLGHFGVFPVPQDLHASDYQLSFQSAGGLLAQLDTLFPHAVIQANHPRWNASIGYFIANGFDPRDPTLDSRLGLSHLDAIEVWNTNELDAAGGPPIEMLLQDYYSLLDLGYSLVATGNTDTHELSRHPLGYPRNCIRVPDDGHPGLSAEALLDGLRAGQVIVTSGPWLEVSLDGHGPGERVPRPAAPILDILVDAASWVTVDRVRVVVDGHEQASFAITSMPAKLQVPLELSDGLSYIMVLAEGDTPLPDLTGQLSVPERSFAFTNPLWVLPP